MATVEIRVPEFGESITEATIVSWLKEEGSQVEADEVLAELETDKVSVELMSPENGILAKINNEANSNVRVGDVVALLEVGAQASKAPSQSPETEAPKEERKSLTASPSKQADSAPQKSAPATDTLSPAVEKLVSENNLDVSKIKGTGKHNQITKEDVLRYLESSKAKSPPAQHSAPPPSGVVSRDPKKAEKKEEIVPMSRLRQVIARRLVEAQQTAAILTTFNEVDMKPVMDLRKKYNEIFLKKYGIKLGFMSIFAKAAIYALKAFPAINAEIRGNDIVYKHYYDIGVAVGGPKGLVVPILRHADILSLAEIETEISRLAQEVQKGTIALSALEGGTFTISNGGVYGSMLSTPIINPPQTGILGMHNIVQRAVVVNGEITIRPMMYLALSYDHRMVDGKEAVQFLVKIKEVVEDPMRILLEI